MTICCSPCGLGLGGILGGFPDFNTAEDCGTRNGAGWTGAGLNSVPILDATELQTLASSSYRLVCP
jgi:hypothetical protein